MKFFSYLKYYYFSGMKKGTKLPELGYLVEINTLRLKDWRTPSPCRSLKEAVEYASSEVQDMDNYLKVYRQIKNAGVYISPFLSIPSAEKPARTVIVQITSYQLLTPKEIADAQAYIERISRGENARSPS